MTEEGSEVPRELTGKGARPPARLCPCAPSPRPLPSSAPRRVPPSRGAPQVAAVPGGAPATLLASRGPRSRARGGGQRGAGPGGASRLAEEGAGCLGRGGSGSQEPPLGRSAHCPKLGEVRGGPAGGLLHLLGPPPPPPPGSPRGAPPARTLRGVGGVWRADRARRGVAWPSRPGAQGLHG